MKIINKQMSIKMQDILLSQGCNPNHFRYIKQNADDIVFKHIKSGKEVYTKHLKTIPSV